MKSSSPYIHPKFKLNGISYTSAEELLNFVGELIIQGDDYEVAIGNFLEQWLNFNDTIYTKTSGSTGSPKNIKLLKKHMIVSAKATGTYFNLKEGTKVLLCLSANYIAGKMMLVRAMVLGWDLHVVAPVKDALTQYDNTYDFVAMVPYQAHYSIPALHKVKKLIIGGGVISEELLQKLQEVDTQVFATYGMTETITHIAVKKINGLDKSHLYHALPNVLFSVDQRGCLNIHAPTISEKKVVTNDLVQLESPTTFSYIGRIDNVINSGGIKIFPEEIEKILSKYVSFPFMITSLKNDALGEIVVLVVEANAKDEISNLSEAFLKLPTYQRPKKVFTFSRLIYTETGKINRKEVLALLKKHSA